MGISWEHPLGFGVPLFWGTKLDQKNCRYAFDFGREVCSHLAVAEEREWLVTNGIGGYASGTIAGLLTRRYHGLLVAALKPPLGRTLLLTKLDETVACNGDSLPLVCQSLGRRRC